MKRALIVKLGAIGDVLMVVPAAHLLHRQGYAIDWVCGPAAEPLLRCYPWIRVISADDKTILSGGMVARMRALLRLWATLLPTRYDLCATLYYDRRWRVMTLPVRAGRRLMLSRTDRARRIVPTRHHNDEFARILLEWPDEVRPQSLPPLRPEVLPASPLPAPRASRVALVPGGASNFLRQQTLRRWPVERYAMLAHTLLERGDEVVLLGGPDDTWVREFFPPHPRLLDAIGTLSLPEVIAACDTCSVVVTHDTGPLHLAGLSLAPVLALFGPTDPGSFLPRRPGVQAIWGGEGFACRPCYDGRDFAPCRENGCMGSISLEAVLTAMDSMRPNTIVQAELQEMLP